MRWLLAFAVTTLTLAAGAWYTTTSPPGEGGMECHGIDRGNRCVQFPPDQRVASLVAAMPIVRRYRPLSDVQCYAKGTLAVCDGVLKHGRFGVSLARFRVHPDGSVTPICPSKRGQDTTSVFCVE
jgi:hypothetical protein